MLKDYHSILGVSKEANKHEIKRSYRRLAKLYHPDMNHSKANEEKFKEINEAYNALINLNITNNPSQKKDSLDDYIYKNFDYLKNNSLENTPFALDLFLHININVQEAVEGVTIKYNHKNGPRTIQIPAHTGEGEIIKIPKLGYRMGSHTGNMYVKIHIKSNSYIRVLENNHILVKHKICPWDLFFKNKEQTVKIFGEHIELNNIDLFGSNRLRIKDKGLFFNNQKERGDLFVSLTFDWFGCSSTLFKNTKSYLSNLKQFINSFK